MTEPKLCECGCGRPVDLASRTDARKGWVKGQPKRFLVGHSGFKQKPKPGPDYIVNLQTGCWVWVRSVHVNGYGRKVLPDGSHVRAHRFVYEALRGPIPEGLELDHLCRNPPCVNPDHLEPVTHAENMRRAIHTKLTADDVREIRRCHAAGEMPKSLSARFGISKPYVWSIIAHKNWRDLPDDDALQEVA